MDPGDRKASKIYRKIMTSDDWKAFSVYERIDQELKIKVKKKLSENGSSHALHVLNKIENSNYDTYKRFPSFTEEM